MKGLRPARRFPLMPRTLQGAPALSEFRRHALLERCRTIYPDIVDLRIDFFYMVRFRETLDSALDDLLNQVLDLDGCDPSTSPRRRGLAHRSPYLPSARHNLALVKQGHRHSAQLRSQCCGPDRARQSLPLRGQRFTGAPGVGIDRVAAALRSHDRGACRRRGSSLPRRGASHPRAHSPHGPGPRSVGKRQCRARPSHVRSGNRLLLRGLPEPASRSH